MGCVIAMACKATLQNIAVNLWVKCRSCHQTKIAALLTLIFKVFLHGNEEQKPCLSLDQLISVVSNTRCPGAAFFKQLSLFGFAWPSKR